MSKSLKWIIGILVLIVLLLLVLKKTGALGKEEGIKVSAEKVIKRTIVESVNASGKIYPEVEVKLSPDISGEIVELTVQEGDSVKKGQVVAKIYADIYATQRDQAQATVSQQQAQVANASAAIESSKAQLDQAKKTYEMQKQLFDQKVISKNEFNTSEATLRSAQAMYNAAVQGIRGGQAGVQGARAGLAKANKDISRANVVAPIGGVISLLNVKKGERVVGSSMMAGTEMMRIADLSRIEVRVDVGENDVPKVHTGDSALVQVEAYSNRKFKGIVTQISSSNNGAAQQSSAMSGATDVTNYKVYIRLLPFSYQDLLDPSKPKSFPFRPGMSASADIQTKTHESRLAVPINAVTTRDKSDTANGNKKVTSGKDMSDQNQDANSQNTSNADDLQEVVFVIQSDNSVKKINVRTDIQDINYIEILSGLKEGDQVVTGPFDIISKKLKNGEKVKVVPKTELFESKAKN